MILLYFLLVFAVVLALSHSLLRFQQLRHQNRAIPPKQACDGHHLDLFTGRIPPENVQ